MARLIDLAGNLTLTAILGGAAILIGFELAAALEAFSHGALLPAGGFVTINRKED